jgi:hypothetical protein
MMKCIVHYYENGLRAIKEPSKKEDRIGFALLKNQTSAQFNKLKEMKFENPKQSKQEIKAYFERFTE